MTKKQSIADLAAKLDDKAPATQPGDIPGFLKRTETPEQVAAREARHARKAAPPMAEVKIGLSPAERAIRADLADQPAKRGKKQHISDAAERARIALAEKFVVSVYRDRKYAKTEAATLAEARAVAKQVAAADTGGRQPMIYALLPSGTQILVPSDYVPEAKQESKMASKTQTKSPATKAKAAAKAKPATKPAKPAKAAKAPRKAKTNGHEAVLAAAREGKVPARPDLTHKSYKKHADAMAALIKAGDLSGLRGYKPTFAEFKDGGCSFRTPLARYREAALIALGTK